jgi:medium-chain acyl-[acyl-carrier-protein] hydrolase
MHASFAIAPVRVPLPPSKWLMCPRPDAGAPLRLWCVPFAGGGAAVWHPWAARLAGLAEVIAVRLPGRENRLAEAAFTRLLQLIPVLIEMIAPFAAEEYALCGHSLGGLVVFELARAMRARGMRMPQALIISGVRAPHYPPDLPLLHQLPQREFVAQVQQRYGDIPSEIRDHPEFLDLLLPVLRADLEMYETYRYVPSAPLDVPILALGGDRDENVTRTQLFDWGAYTNGQFEAEIIPGGHFFQQENLALTTDRVREFLAQVTPAASAATVRQSFILPRQPNGRFQL